MAKVNSLKRHCQEPKNKNVIKKKWDVQKPATQDQSANKINFPK